MSALDELATKLAALKVDGAYLFDDSVRVPSTRHDVGWKDGPGHGHTCSGCLGWWTASTDLAVWLEAVSVAFSKGTAPIVALSDGLGHWHAQVVKEESCAVKPLLALLTALAQVLEVKQ